VSHRDQDAASAAELFDLLWESLADVLGTAAGATLLRRAIKRAASRSPSAELVFVARDGLDYKYCFPETWNQPGNEDAIRALRVMAAELRVLLFELTGPVVVRRLARLAPFRELGIDFSDEAPT
jgi:hypothetical protein